MTSVFSTVCSPPEVESSVTIYLKPFTKGEEHQGGERMKRTDFWKAKRNSLKKGESSPSRRNIYIKIWGCENVWLVCGDRGGVGWVVGEDVG